MEHGCYITNAERFEDCLVPLSIKYDKIYSFAIYMEETHAKKIQTEEHKTLFGLFFVCLFCYPLSGIVGAGGAGLPSHIS